jgi:hypothetical protein
VDELVLQAEHTSRMALHVVTTLDSIIGLV